MQEKLLRTIHCEYQPAMYLGANFSGWTPIGDYVLVRPDDVARKTSGGIDLPDDLAERMQLAAITGVIIECGDEAFRWNADRTRPHEGYKPIAGDRVIFEKYAGKPILGEDGKNYRILEDKAIGGIKKRKA
jgi:co-chaperonin GroES (HSP10)